MTQEEETKVAFIQNVKKKLCLFFPEDSYSFTNQSVEEGLEFGSFMVKPSRILPLVQTALLDNKILEIETDGLTRVYFSRLYDDIPDLEETEDEDGEFLLLEPDYITGDYLKLMNHLICLPVEPGMGNLQVRNSQRVIIRFFTATMAIELGTFFQDLSTVRGLPVLRLAFPAIGRQVKGSRAYRAKVTEKIDFSIVIKGKRKLPDVRSRPIDISSKGMSFEVQKKEQKRFRVDEICKIQLIVAGELLAVVESTIRHVSQIREKTGIQYRCGVQFDLPTRSIAATIESLVADVQRVHLQELSNISEESGIVLVQ